MFSWPDRHRPRLLKNGFRTIMCVAFGVDLHSVILLVSSSMADTSPMCVCPCASTRSQSMSFRYHSTSSGNITSSTFKKSSPLLYVLTTTDTNATSAFSSLSSSACYCPCSITSSASYLLCKYPYRNRLA